MPNKTSPEETFYSEASVRLTHDQMKRVKKVQLEGREIHPLTCAWRSEPPHKEFYDELDENLDHGTLFPTSRYLVCPACGYRQDYSHPAAQMLLEIADRGDSTDAVDENKPWFMRTRT